MTSTAREQFIETTCTLLELQGYHATGLNQIVAESGSPKGSLYHYFPGGKESLVTEALEAAGARIEARIRAELQQHDTAALAVYHFVTHLAEAVEASGFQAGAPITTVAMEVAVTNPHLRQVCHKIFQQWQLAIADRLRADGIYSAESLALMCIASIEGGILLSRTARSRQPLEEIAEHLAHLIATSSPN
jgi:TetR/AcrR family transcriptional repressor of lmrAB and yxaGH operons